MYNKILTRISSLGVHQKQPETPEQLEERPGGGLLWIGNWTSGVMLSSYRGASSSILEYRINPS